MYGKLQDQIGSHCRRQFLTGMTTAAAVAAAGCSTLTDWFGDQFLEEVNILNENNSPISGQIEVSDPADAVVLEETFELVSADATDDEEEGNMAFYEDVWTTDGSYEVSIELIETDIDGVDSATTTVTVTNPDEEMLLVAFGADEIEGSIGFRVGERFSEIFDE